MFDIERAETRTIAAYRDDFVITELGNCLDRIFEALGKTVSGLAMNMGTGNAHVPGGREKMNVDRWGKFGGKCRKIQERPRRHRERASRQIDMRSLGEDENGSSGHAYGIRNGSAGRQVFSVLAFDWKQFAQSCGRGII